MSQISDDVSSLQSSVEVLELPENSLLGDISSLMAEIAIITSSELYQRSRLEARNSQTSRLSSENFPYVEGSPFKGIISSRSSECGRNVHENGVVSITASSNHGNQCHQVTNYDWNDWWITNNEPKSWICFDFKEKRVNLTGYSLKSDGLSHYNLLQWVVEGSNDAKTWRELDNRDTQDLSRAFVVKSYSCQSPASESFRYIRLRQTGKNSYGKHYLFLSEIEFFGTLHRT